MTLVLDASAFCGYLLGDATADETARLLREHGDAHMPHLAVVETASVLRRLARQHRVSTRRGREALADLADAPVQRWPAEPLLPRIWALRDNLSAYDATYVALAESLGATLVTTDARLAHAAEGLARCQVATVAPDPR